MIKELSNLCDSYFSFVLNVLTYHFILSFSILIPKSFLILFQVWFQNRRAKFRRNERNFISHRNLDAPTSEQPLPPCTNATPLSSAPPSSSHSFDFCAMPHSQCNSTCTFTSPGGWISLAHICSTLVAWVFRVNVDTFRVPQGRLGPLNRADIIIIWTIPRLLTVRNQ